MKKQLTNYVLLLFLFFGFIGSAQYKYEREYRIRNEQFPEKALNTIHKKLNDAKRIRFYKETDSTKVSYEAKFKKERLWYSVEFDKEGILEDIEIRIKPVDIPDDSFANIKAYLNKSFIKYRIRKLQQQYLVSSEENVETTLKNAFQNLMLPSINYEIIVAGKKTKAFEQFEILFGADGQFISIRKSLPPNYDHVLY